MISKDLEYTYTVDYVAEKFEKIASKCLSIVLPSTDRLLMAE